MIDKSARALRMAAALAAGALTLAIQPGSLAWAQVPPDVAAKIAAIGRVVDPPGTAKIYAPLQTASPPVGLLTRRDVPYGPGPKDTLDLFTLGKGPARRPILIFVHGGGFTGGDKSRNPDGEPSPFYDNIMYWAVGHGLVGVNINYEWAPKAKYPEVQRDIAEVVAWARKNAASFGGDPNRIFLWGHSAGAAHVASFLAHPETYADIPGAQVDITGAILTSGLYEFANPAKPADNVYYGPAGTLAERSSTAGLIKSRTPLLVAYAELDPPPMVAQAQALDAALTAAGRDHALLLAAKHGHMSESYAINTGDESVSGPVMRFIRKYGE
jgi:triacylglycerol lipase